MAHNFRRHGFGKDLGDTHGVADGGPGTLSVPDRPCHSTVWRTRRNTIRARSAIDLEKTAAA